MVDLTSRNWVGLGIFPVFGRICLISIRFLNRIFGIGFAGTAINVREEIPEAADGRADTSEEAKEAELEAAKKDAKELRAGFDIENQKYNTKKVKRTKTAKGVKKSTQIKLTGLNIFSSAKLKTEAPNQTNLKAGKRAEAARQAEKDLQKQKEEQAAKVTADLAEQQMEEKVR